MPAPLLSQKNLEEAIGRYWDADASEDHALMRNLYRDVQVAFWGRRNMGALRSSEEETHEDAVAAYAEAVRVYQEVRDHACRQPWYTEELEWPLHQKLDDVMDRYWGAADQGNAEDLQALYRAVQRAFRALDANMEVPSARAEVYQRIRDHAQAQPWYTEALELPAPRDRHRFGAGRFGVALAQRYDDVTRDAEGRLNPRTYRRLAKAFGTDSDRLLEDAAAAETSPFINRSKRSAGKSTYELFNSHTVVCATGGNAAAIVGNQQDTITSRPFMVAGMSAAVERMVGFGDPKDRERVGFRSVNILYSPMPWAVMNAQRYALESDMEHYISQPAEISLETMLPLVAEQRDGQWVALDAETVRRNMRINLAGYSYGGMYLLQMLNGLGDFLEGLPDASGSRAFTAEEIQGFFDEILLYMIDVPLKMERQRFTPKTMYLFSHESIRASDSYDGRGQNLDMQACLNYAMREGVNTMQIGPNQVVCLVKLGVEVDPNKGVTVEDVRHVLHNINTVTAPQVLPYQIPNAFAEAMKTRREFVLHYDEAGRRYILLDEAGRRAFLFSREDVGNANLKTVRKWLRTEIPLKDLLPQETLEIMKAAMARGSGFMSQEVHLTDGLASLLPLLAYDTHLPDIRTLAGMETIPQLDLHKEKERIARDGLRIWPAVSSVVGDVVLHQDPDYWRRHLAEDHERMAGYERTRRQADYWDIHAVRYGVRAEVMRAHEEILERAPVVDRFGRDLEAWHVEGRIRLWHSLQAAAISNQDMPFRLRGLSHTVETIFGAPEMPMDHIVYEPLPARRASARIRLLNAGRDNYYSDESSRRAERLYFPLVADPESFEYDERGRVVRGNLHDLETICTNLRELSYCYSWGGVQYEETMNRLTEFLRASGLSQDEIQKAYSQRLVVSHGVPVAMERQGPTPPTIRIYSAQELWAAPQHDPDGYHTDPQKCYDYFRETGNRMFKVGENEVVIIVDYPMNPKDFPSLDEFSFAAHQIDTMLQRDIYPPEVLHAMQAFQGMRPGDEMISIDNLLGYADGELPRLNLAERIYVPPSSGRVQDYFHLTRWDHNLNQEQQVSDMPATSYAKYASVHWPEPPINWPEAMHRYSTGQIDTPGRNRLRQRAIDSMFYQATRDDLLLIVTAQPGAGKTYFETSEDIWKMFGGTGKPVNVYFDEVVRGDPATGYTGLPEVFDAFIFGHTPHITAFVEEVIGVWNKALPKAQQEGYGLRRSAPPANPNTFQQIYDQHHALGENKKVGAIITSVHPVISTGRKAVRSEGARRYIGDLLSLYRCRESSENTLACARIVDELMVYSNNVDGAIPRRIAHTAVHEEEFGPYPDTVVDDAGVENYLDRLGEKLKPGHHIPIGNNKYLVVDDPVELRRHFTYKHINPFARSPQELWIQPARECIERLAHVIDPEGKEGVAKMTGDEVIARLASVQVPQFENYYYHEKFARVQPVNEEALDPITRAMFDRLVGIGVHPEWIFYKGDGNYDPLIGEPPLIVDFSRLDMATKVEAAKVLNPGRVELIDQAVSRYIVGTPVAESGNMHWVAQALRMDLEQLRFNLSRQGTVDYNAAQMLEESIRFQVGADSERISDYELRVVLEIYRAQKSQETLPQVRLDQKGEGQLRSWNADELGIVIINLILQKLFDQESSSGDVDPEEVRKVMAIIREKVEFGSREPLGRLMNILEQWSQSRCENPLFTGEMRNILPDEVKDVLPQVVSLSFHTDKAFMEVRCIYALEEGGTEERIFPFDDPRFAQVALNILSGRASVEEERERLKGRMEDAVMSRFLEVPPVPEKFLAVREPVINRSLFTLAEGFLRASMEAQGARSEEEGHVVIIGSGLTGIVTLFQLLKKGVAAERITVFDKSGTLGGVAWGQAEPEHTTNAYASLQSPLLDDRRTFINWLNDPANRVYWPPEFVEKYADVEMFEDTFFAPRQLYNVFLSSLWREAERLAQAQGVTLNYSRKNIIDGQREGYAVCLEAEDGTEYRCDHVVIATGFDSTVTPDFVWPIENHPAYFGEVWRDIATIKDIAADEGKHKKFLILGNGATASDMVVSLHAAGFEGEILSLSRTNTPPKVRDVENYVPGFMATEEVEAIRELIRGHMRKGYPTTLADGLEGWVAGVIQHALEEGHGIDHVLDAIEGPLGVEVWKQVPVADKKTILAKYGTLYSSHRAQKNPDIHDLETALEAEGSYRRLAVEVEKIIWDGKQFEVTYIDRATQERTVEKADYVLNALGQEMDIDRQKNPLLRNLAARGLATKHELGLGVNINDRGQLMGVEGPSQRFSCVGPMVTGYILDTTLKLGTAPAIPALKRVIDATVDNVMERMQELFAIRQSLRSPFLGVDGGVLGTSADQNGTPKRENGK